MSYLGAVQKRAVQNIALQSSNTTLIGLGGPNVKQYVNYLRTKGFKDIIIFENNKSIYEKQVEQKPRCQLIHGNILDHLGYNAFYDLDFCASVKTIEPWLPKIIAMNEYAMTLSIRPVGIINTIGIIKKYTELKYIPYRDTVPMYTFFKHKNKPNEK